MRGPRKHKVPSSSASAAAARGPPAPRARRPRRGLRPPRHRRAIYHVTSIQDDGRGTIGFWIIFELSGTIHLHSYLRVASYKNKTINGKGAPAQDLASRHHLQPGVRGRPGTRRRRHPDQARIHQHLDRPMLPSRLRRRAHRHHATEHRHHGLKQIDPWMIFEAHEPTHSNQSLEMPFCPARRCSSATAESLMK
uniref:Uncharacterized protein n=1 Tax=Setaria viridis TaxID=4556 RepID=A0A4U6VKP2_SETVI|nr:hypothetical protein SEVIR_3G078500v2 [Setaria viridis]